VKTHLQQEVRRILRRKHALPRVSDTNLTAVDKGSDPSPLPVPSPKLGNSFQRISHGSTSRLPFLHCDGTCKRRGIKGNETAQQGVTCSRDGFKAAGRGIKGNKNAQQGVTCSRDGFKAAGAPTTAAKEH
jgi:hypothetical protein